MVTLSLDVSFIDTELIFYVIRANERSEKRKEKEVPGLL